MSGKSPSTAGFGGPAGRLKNAAREQAGAKIGRRELEAAE
jgi:hypothetical protein